jgi:hypothetical protein
MTMLRRIAAGAKLFQVTDNGLAVYAADVGALPSTAILVCTVTDWGTTEQAKRLCHNSAMQPTMYQ